jgi:clan AA aspartic protease (TIGR02281 family)
MTNAILAAVVLVMSLGFAGTRNCYGQYRDNPVGVPLLTAQNTAPASDQPANGQAPVVSKMLPTIDRPARPHDTNTASSNRHANGYFIFDTEINGVGLPMVFDTGASMVMLRAEDAIHVGIDISALNYSTPISTPNGISQAARTMIARMKIGGITRTNVAAVVAKRGALQFNLLGQSFLATIAGFVQEDSRLVLRGN